jgi:hypothetical protein
MFKVFFYLKKGIPGKILKRRKPCIIQKIADSVYSDLKVQNSGLTHKEA